MGFNEVKIFLKLSVFFFIGMFIQGSLGLFASLLILPNLKENIEYIFQEHYFNLGFGFFGVSLLIGTFVALSLIVFVSYFLSFKLIDWTVGWADVEQKFSKIFKRGR